MQTNSTQEPSWKREETVAHVAAFEAAARQAQSQREYCRAQEVPRGTLQHWVKRKGSLDDSPTLIAFFESAEGLAFLHRLVIAVQFAMTYLSSGLRAVQTVFELAGLEPFVANSFGSRQKLGRSMEEQIRGFAQEQRAELGAQMAPKAITVCEDETFHPAVCLVAIEPVSGFILLETYAQRRDEQTWNAALDKALVGLPLQVCQSTSDEGKGLLAHATKGLKAHHSPDLFHVQHEVCHAVSAVLATQVRQAEAVQDKATEAVEARRLEQQTWPQQSHGPGRPPDLAGRVAAAQQDAAVAEQELAAARDRQERARGAMQGLGHAYHPVEFHSGAVRSAAQVESELQQHFATLKAVVLPGTLDKAEQGGLRASWVMAEGASAIMSVAEGKQQRMG